MTAAYVDANVIVFAFGDPNHPRRSAARLLLERTADSHDLVTSVLTVDEFLWARRREHGVDAAVVGARVLLATKFLIFVDVETPHASAAVDFIEHHRLKPRDALHAAVARAKGCTLFLSDDPDFDVVPGLNRVAP